MNSLIRLFALALCVLFTSFAAAFHEPDDLRDPDDGGGGGGFGTSLWYYSLDDLLAGSLFTQQYASFDGGGGGVNVTDDADGDGWEEHIAPYPWLAGSICSDSGTQGDICVLHNPFTVWYFIYRRLGTGDDWVLQSITIIQPTQPEPEPEPEEPENPLSPLCDWWYQGSDLVLIDGQWVWVPRSPHRDECPLER